jgi:hypothetical protein
VFLFLKCNDVKLIAEVARQINETKFLNARHKKRPRVGAKRGVFFGPECQRAPLPRIAQRARPVATQSCLLNRVCANRFVACETKQLPEDNNASALRCAGGLRRSASGVLSVSGEAFALLHVLAK